MKVWVVLDGAYQPLAVFTTREKAEAYVAQLPQIQGSLGPYRLTTSIMSFEVDDGAA